MNIVKRSILYIIRKKSRTLLLFAILLVVSTLILSGLSIMDATKDSSAKLRESTGAGFTMERNLNTAKRSNSGNTFLYQQEYITDEMIKKISKIDGIKGYNAKIALIPDLQGADGKNLETIIYTNWYDDPIFKYNAKVFACFNTNYDSYFSTNEFQIIEGRHIIPDDNFVIIISNKLAEKYHLKVGDKIKLAITEEFVAAEKQSGTNGISANDVDVEIIGIFNISTEQADSDTLAQSQLYENYVFSDMMSYKELYSTWAEVLDKDGYTAVDFFLADPAQLSSIMSEVLNISSINWNNFELIANDEVYQSSSSSMSNIDKLISTMILIVAIIAVIIITLILSMWIRNRIHEAGVLMAVGISKFNIILQYILETVLNAILAFYLSYFTSNAVAGSLGHIIDSTIASNDVTVVIENFIITCSLGVLMILVALIISCIPVMLLKPKEILSKMC